MRFEQVSYTVDDVTVAVSFHSRLTVIGPLGSRARSRWVGRLLGVLAGTRSGDGVTAVFVEAAGQAVRLERDRLGGARVTGAAPGDERVPPPPHLPLDGRFDWFASIGFDTDDAGGVMVLEASAFKRDEDFDVWQIEDDLVQARRELDQAESEYEAAMAQVQLVADLYQQVADVDHWIGGLEEERARRRHRQALAALRRQEDELADLRRALSSEQGRTEALVAAARTGAEWRRSLDSLAVARLAFGDRARLDPEDLRRALDLPTELPRGFDEREAAYRSVRARRIEFERPSAPFVLTLAGRNQRDLWERAERAQAAIDRWAELSSEGDPSGLLDELEVAHRAVEAAERELEAARLPALAVSGRRALSRAQHQERAVLSRMGCSSWFAFQMERVDALMEREARDARQAAEADQQEAVAAWQEVAVGVELGAALAARAEIEHLAAEPTVRGELERLDPAYATAREALLAACGAAGAGPPHGGPDPDPCDAAAQARDLVTRARNARVQHALEEAEAACRAAGERLRRSLAAVDRLCPGGPDDLTEMVGWVTRLAAEATSPSRTPLGSRVAELETDVEAARAAVAAGSRPEWDEPPPGVEEASSTEPSPLPDPDALEEERARLFEEAHQAERALPDVSRLDDRRRELARRIARLEDTARVGYRLVSVGEAEMVLVDRVAAASHSGPRGEPVPVIVDDALAAFERGDRRDLLHLLARLGEATQVVYLTEDAATLDWAAAMAGEGDVSLVHPPPDRLPRSRREVA